MKFVNEIYILVLSLLVAAPVHAEKMDQDTHSIVISKLETALSTLRERSSERTSITLRLADLYADRARLQFIKKNDEQCAACEDGSKDRERALGLYIAVVDRLKGQPQGETLLQMAHLQTMLNQTSAATKVLTRIISQAKSYDGVVGARAHAALGEIQYRQVKYKDAEKSFQTALTVSEIPNRGFLTYRLAWAQLNLGKNEEATSTLIKILKTPDLLSVKNQSGTQFDASFHQDVARDLVSFMARGDVAETEIQTLLSLTPDAQRKENLYAFANELERLGKKYSATLAWHAYYSEGQTNPIESLETQVRVAQLQWDMGRKDQALGEYQKAAELMRKQACDNAEKCDELRKRFRNFVINWNKTEKDHPSASCLAAYQAYVSVFKTESDMHYKAAEVATSLKNNSVATSLYAQAALLARDELKAAKDASKKKAAQELLDVSLLRQIESAEASKSVDHQIAAYENYLTLNPKGDRIVEVRYQKAQAIYTKGDYKSAFSQFQGLATDGGSDHRELRLKAADLSLDTLVLLKDDAAIEKMANDLCRIYPEREIEYRKIQRKAAVRLAVGSLAEKKASESQLREELARLKATHMTGANADEKMTILKNEIALAERLQQLDDVVSAADGILQIRPLSDSDREFALGRKTWVAEIRMDFASALKISQQMKLNHLNSEERELRLAMFAELAGQDPTRHYQIALKSTRSKAKANAIRANLVRLAKNNWQELEKNQRELSQTPELFSNLILEAHAEKRNDRLAHKLAMLPALKRQAARKVILRQDLIAQWQTQDRKISKHQLNSRSEGLLQKTLRDRISLLNQLDLVAKSAVSGQDWTTQLLSITTIARENRRLYTDILALPVPKQLSGSDKKQYQALIQQKANPFKDRADQADRKVSQFWSNRSALSEIQTGFRNASPEVQNLLSGEIRLLAQVAPNSERRMLESLLSDRVQRPSAKQILEARRRLVKSPFDTSLIQELKDLESKRGELTMVAFLDARLDQVKTGAKR